MSDKADLPQDEVGPDIQQPGLKFLERAVYIMGGLLVLMLVGLIGGIVWKISHRREAPPAATQLLDLGLPAGTQLLDLGLPAGTQVQAMQLDGDRLVLKTGAEIIIIDIRRNYVMSRISTAAK